MQRLHHDHRNLARLLDLLERQVTLFGQAEAADLELMVDIMDYIENYANQVHHPTEDVVYEHLLAHAGEAADDARLLMREHAELIERTSGFRRVLEGVLQGSVESREAIEARGRSFLAEQREHMRTEEARVFPFADKVLSDGDWAEVEHAAPNFEDPLFGNQVLTRYRELFQHITGG
jgi:hemerythrin-like domain-containing protein